MGCFGKLQPKSQGKFPLWCKQELGVLARTISASNHRKLHGTSHFLDDSVAVYKIWFAVLHVCKCLLRKLFIEEEISLFCFLSQCLRSL